MNLKTSDRLSAGLVGISLLLMPLVLWKPVMLAAVAVCLAAVVFLNRNILIFYARKRGVLFAAMTFPWQLLYFFYSGVVFALCWFWYKFPRILGMKAGHETSSS